MLETRTDAIHPEGVNRAGENKTSEQLQREIDEYRILFDSTPIMFWYKDKKNVHIRVNKAAAALEGISPDAIEGKSAYDLYPREQADAFHKDDMDVIISGKPKLSIVEKHTRPATGEVMWLQTGKVPYRNKNGEIIGVVAFAVDITEQKNAEEAVRQAHKELEQRSRQMARANEFFRSTLEQLTEAVQRGVTDQALLDHLNIARREFERYD